MPVKLDPDRELRLAIVMYGGVSLAVYMNGVTQELLQLVRATAADSNDPATARFSDADLGVSTAAVYREAARMALDQGGSEPGPEAPIRQRVVIDILSGTSAGGINAIFLAKALANGQPLDGLARMWESDADIDTLINDRKSMEGVWGLLPTGKPRSLLNSERMFAKLRSAFDQMDDATPAGATRLADDVRLFVTTTDLDGLPVRLHLGGGEVAEERRHKKVFNLIFDRARNDFTRADNPFLAFVARCTSSFPFAFEPTQLKLAQGGWWGIAPDVSLDRWARHFQEYPRSMTHLDRYDIERPFGDGGYLDNKPFGWAIDAIGARGGAAPARVERKLVFVDPDPERILKTGGGDEHPAVPDAIENSLIALRLPAYETIREDLLRLRDRNRVVDKVQSVIRGVTADFNRLEPGQRTDLADLINDREHFSRRDLNTVVARFGAPYGGYHRLKVARLTDELAELVANHMRLPVDSDEFRFLRLIVQTWRNARYTPNPSSPDPSGAPTAARASEFELLRSMDTSYQVRRLVFAIEQINRLHSANAAEFAETLAQTESYGATSVLLAGSTARADLLAVLRQRRQSFADILRDLRADRERLLGVNAGLGDSTAVARLRAAMTAGRADFLGFLEQLGALSGDRARRAKADELLRDRQGAGLAVVQGLQDAIAAVVSDIVTRASDRCEQLVADIGTAMATASGARTVVELADNFVRHHYAWYELYDSMVFPIVYGSEVGEELAPVEPVRISPLSGRAAAGVGPDDAQRLPAGLALGHFGAFLDGDWRSRDILLGRLNAADKLMRMLLTGVAGAEGRVDAFVDRVQRAVIADELAHAGSHLSRWAADQRLTGVDAVSRNIAERGLATTPLSRENVLGWLTRGVRVSSRIFDRAADGGSLGALTRIFTRAGQVFFAISEVAMPRRWWGLLSQRWLVQLWVFSLVFMVLAGAFNNEGMQHFFGQLLLAFSVVGLAVILLRSWIAGRRWFRLVSLVLLLFVLTLAAVGGGYLWQSRGHIGGAVRTLFSLRSHSVSQPEVHRG